MDYIDSCIDRFDLRPHISFDSIDFLDAKFDPATRRWRLAMTIGGKPTERHADVVVGAVGQLNVPSLPPIKGLDRYSGTVVHTARWRSDIKFEGKRVALIGSGASAVQIGPTIAPSVSRLLAFQRSPQWLSSRPLYHQPVSPQDLWGYENVPFYLNWYRLTLYWTFGDRLYNALLLENGLDGLQLSTQNNDLRQMFTKYIHEKLPGRPDLIEKVMPDYPPMAKRIPIDFGWFDMLKRDNVELVTDAIDHIETDAVVTVDGRRHEVDLIVLATGFQATRMLQAVPIHGRNGSDLQEVWSGDNPRAYLGMMVPDFPNFFIMYGPNKTLATAAASSFRSNARPVILRAPSAI